MAFFTLFIATVSYLFGQTSGYGISYAGMALIISGLISLASFYWSDKVVLAMSRAKEADRGKDAELIAVCENVASQAKIPIPKVYVIEEKAPNAFATGRDSTHAVVCVTRGLLETLKSTELEGVIAHEISHIQNYDTRLMAIVSVLIGMVAFLSDTFMRSLWFGSVSRQSDREEKGNLGSILFLVGIILAIISPIIATLIQLSISRRREFLADASSALLTHNPEGLASALEKISKSKEILPIASSATAHLFIVNPFAGKTLSSFASLFNTHPPVEERIKILRNMAI